MNSKPCHKAIYSQLILAGGFKLGLLLVLVRSVNEFPTFRSPAGTPKVT